MIQLLRIYVVIFFLVFIAPAWSGGDRGVDLLDVTLELKNELVGECSSFTIRIDVRNVSKEPIEIPAIMLHQHYWLNFVLLDPYGMQLEYRGVKNNPRGSGSKIILRPSYALTHDYTLTCKDYDFSKRGDYSLKAIYGRGPDGAVLNSGLIQSNSLLIPLNKKSESE